MTQTVDSVAAKAFAGERLSADEGLLLHERADLATLGLLADEARRARHPENVVTYIVDRNVNPTNVCITDCSFCAFYRRPNEAEAYVLPRETLYLADEVFFVGTAVEVTPIRSVDRITVGRGRRGPITEAIQQRFFQIVRGEAPDTHGWLQFVNAPATAASAGAKGR